MKSISASVFMIALSLSNSALGASAPKDLISKEKATQIAVKASPGTVASSELEFERKQWVYSFDIRGSDHRIHEVLVNAKSGKIVANSIETPAQQAKERKADGEQ